MNIIIMELKNHYKSWVKYLLLIIFLRSPILFWKMKKRLIMFLLTIPKYTTHLPTLKDLDKIIYG